MDKGFVYLIAIMDWYSRYVISWNLSVTMDVDFCIESLERALQIAVPEIFNSDQGPQYTCKDFTENLLEKTVKISMDGRGRVFDNIFVERLWRSLKYEEVYTKEYSDVWDAAQNIGRYFRVYNEKRIHQSLDYKTPKQVYLGLSKTGSQRQVA